MSEAVYLELCKIPLGSVISYRELAKRLGMPKSVRAIATIVGKNPTPIHVPCHRVIRTNGELGEYTTGQQEGVPARDSQKKLKLLEKEGVIFEKKIKKNGKSAYVLKSAQAGYML